jgi:hypothetical protein
LNNYQNKYQNFDSRKIHKFLDNYLKQENKSDSFNREKMKSEFLSVLDFIQKYFPKALHTHKKIKNQYEPTTRIKFESITVGVALALRENQDLIPKSTSFIDSKEFNEITKSDASSSRKKVIRRIEYVRDRLLGN